MSKTSKQSMAVIMGVSFVWFTTHFGGGFASGAQLFSYFGRFGALSLLMPVLAMLYNAVFFGYALHFARKHNVYDYRSYNNAFYGKFAPVFSNLFEIIYLVTMCLAPSVAFATGGATLSEVTGIPYMICTIIIGVFIFIIAIYGTGLVRKVSSVLSVVIIVGLMLVYIPNIAVGFGAITEAVKASSFDGITVREALYSAFLYGSFQLINIAVFIQHAESFEKPADAKKSMGIGFVINAIMMVIVSLGLLSVSQNPEIAQQSVPTLFMVKNGVGASFMTPIISILIILGAVTTAVNMVAAMVKRITAGIARRKDKQNSEGSKNIKTTIIVALICCLVDFGIAQFGLLTLVKQAYSMLAYLEIPVILIPYLIHMFYTRFGKKEVTK
ncbi:MAG: hypothetical protein KBS83_03720 [Lachnospiraceae bacterium]|nr:hypothetical protein [Candidatus Equihabitans merdae]